jgi:hypothetical protein
MFPTTRRAHVSSSLGFDDVQMNSFWRLGELVACVAL